MFFLDVVDLESSYIIRRSRAHDYPGYNIIFWLWFVYFVYKVMDGIFAGLQNFQEKEKI